MTAKYEVEFGCDIPNCVSERRIKATTLQQLLVDLTCYGWVKLSGSVESVLCPRCAEKLGLA